LDSRERIGPADNDQALPRTLVQRSTACGTACRGARALSPARPSRTPKTEHASAAPNCRQTGQQQMLSTTSGCPRHCLACRTAAGRAFGAPPAELGPVAAVPDAARPACSMSPPAHPPGTLLTAKHCACRHFTSRHALAERLHVDRQRGAGQLSAPRRPAGGCGPPGSVPRRRSCSLDGSGFDSSPIAAKTKTPSLVSSDKSLA